MSFGSRESSRHLAQPITLYLFITGPGPSDYQGYTDSEDPIVIGSIVYQPVPIEHDEIESRGGVEDGLLSIETAADVALAEVFRTQAATSPVSLFIRQGHHGEAEYAAVWSGRVTNQTREKNNRMVLTASPLSSSLEKSGVRRNYQYGCPFVLYGPECKATKTALTATTTSVAGKKVNLASGWTANPSHYLGGLIEKTIGGRRYVATIRAISSSRFLTLSTPFPGLVTGDTVSVYKGCNHTLPHCETLHNNVRNYGGQPWIPLENPVGYVNRFY